jgi:hypothetical protein
LGGYFEIRDGIGIPARGWVIIDSGIGEKVPNPGFQLKRRKRQLFPLREFIEVSVPGQVQGNNIVKRRVSRKDGNNGSLDGKGKKQMFVCLPSTIVVCFCIMSY